AISTQSSYAQFVGRSQSGHRGGGIRRKRVDLLSAGGGRSLRNSATTCSSSYIRSAARVRWSAEGEMNSVTSLCACAARSERRLVSKSTGFAAIFDSLPKKIQAAK